ncbi:uncharacterized protein MONOS_382 [Monocercomonoides exilis]|uniref:uncharacterized protein n=1 Tax=Monocercomonoides exilis TaxID=2049356 RepID=UPI0035595C4F|nr:hypothetical protein MONOS_382 [Monocercomonoides exilis]|eukprot:MONOS_382.1-p1 / transcript=MONOS_382.1 / gene=MONOS_382 / organism=Monocercomonoides_exilis_PA203 / gene_product=unspecified product / transcript_product=unspecified product / location=Mono_scaffold00006:148287-149378(-) / protein_length=217 / sequence_SO=supercontig / SO=protein_coding / is_pseudo=false
MHTIVPTVAKKGEGKATVVQRMYMLLEQTTDSRDSEESEWPVTSPGGSGAGLSSAGDVPLQAWSTARERPMSAVSGSLGLGWVLSLAGRGGCGEAGVWGLCGHVAGGEASGAEEERCGAVSKDAWEELFRKDFSEMELRGEGEQIQMSVGCLMGHNLRKRMQIPLYSSVGGREERITVGVVPYCAAAGRDGEAAAEEDVQSMVETKEGQIVLVQFS